MMAINRIRHSWLILFTLSGVLLFFHRVIFTHETFYFRDIHRLFYPMKYFFAASLKSGALPYWCRYYFCGAPFLSDIQSGVFFTITMVFFFFPYQHAFKLYILLHIVLGFCFFYLFIRSTGLSKKAAIFTGVSFCYGGLTIASINVLNNLSTLIWLPAILWSFQNAIMSGYRSRFFLTVIFLCMAILGGEPQIFIMSVGLLLIYGFFMVPKKGPDRLSSLSLGALIVTLTLAAITITMVQLGPTYQDYLNSVRFGGIPYADATAHSLGWDMLKHLIIPLRFDSDFSTTPAYMDRFFPGQGSIPWLLSIYPGFLIAPIALIGLFSNCSRKIVFWLFIFLFSLILSLGRNTPVYHLFYYIFPFFRYPEKFIYIAGFGLLVVSAHGMDRMIELLKSKGVHSIRLFIIMILVLYADLYINHHHLNPTSDARFYDYRHPDLKPIFEDPTHFRIYVDSNNVAPAKNINSIQNTHILWQMTNMPNLGILNHFSHTGGTSGLELNYQYLITEILLKSWPEKIRFLRLANVKYIISPLPLHQLPEMNRQITKLNELVYRIDDHLPRAGMIGHLQTVKDGIIESLTNEGFDPRSSAFAPDAVAEKYNRSFFKAVDRIDYNGDSTISVSLHADQPSVLFISEVFYPGWRVFVDGHEKKEFPLNLLFQGVEIDEGRHRVEFIYRPLNLRVYMTISIVSSIVCVAWWFIQIARERRQRNSSNKLGNNLADLINDQSQVIDRENTI